MDQKAHDVVEEPELRLLIAEALLKEESALTNEDFDHYKKAIDKNNKGKITYEDYVSDSLCSSNTSLEREPRT